MCSARIWPILCSVLISHSAVAGSYLVRWPKAVLPENDDMRIYELTITLKCGYFKAISNLPDDWNLEIVRPISGISELRAEAGHGANAIPSMIPFNDVIKVSYETEDVGCFELSANILQFGADKVIEVRNEDFILAPVP